MQQSESRGWLALAELEPAPGALKAITRGDELARRPREAFRRVVRGMLPHNKLGDAMINKLKIFDGPDHSHQAQKPVEFSGFGVHPEP